MLIHLRISLKSVPRSPQTSSMGMMNTRLPKSVESQGLYGEANAYFRHMEDGDEEALASWRRFRSDLGMDKKGDIQEVRWWISIQLSIYWMDTQIFG
jgi:hypothetical protein